MARGASHGGEGIEPLEGTKEELTPQTELHKMFDAQTNAKAGSSGTSGQSSIINRFGEF